jgi:DedD protein
MLDTRVKQRLTGAIILVALLVLLVPELLTGPSRSASSAQTPASGEDAQLRSYKIELNDTPRSGTPRAVDTPGPEPKPAQSSGAAQASGAAGVEAGNAGATQPESIDSSPQPEKPPAPAPRVEAAKPPPARVAETAKPPPPVRVAEGATRSGSAEPRPAAGWAWQVGSFASRENAERLTRELKGKGFAATVSESTGKGKRLWRVRVGPEEDRAAAVALGAKLRGAGHPGGAPVQYP